MTEIEQLKQDLGLAREARDRLGHDMSILRTCIEGSTVEEMRVNINALRALRLKYESALPVVKAAYQWQRAMLGEATPQPKPPAPLTSAGDLLARAIEKHKIDGGVP